ncbi:hypothetical protein CPC08DRAFT_733776 [Agrocybe pediades]|nr:hypothetical protein CPC08DRAFT_733776 [Agrocybe pediades]
MPQQQIPFNPTSWLNPQLPNNINTMATFNLPAFLPQQIMQEALAMSAPVEASDEPTLLNKLLGCARRKESYKDALNSLHGKNGHSASLWKDYYLDNKDRLDAWITMCLKKEQEKEGKANRSVSSDVDRVKSSTPNKPSSSYKPSPTPLRAEQPVASTSRSSNTSKPQKKAKTATPPLVLETASLPASRRSTINSLTAPSPVFDNRLPAPNAEIKIPDPPSRSPSPPTNVIPHRRGNKYTQEDREFFVKFVGWRLKQDPTLTRLELCNLLAEKAPHHTAQSWASHWSNNHDVPDKILAAARGDENRLDKSSPDEGTQARAKQRPTYKDPSSTEESEDDNSNDDASSESHDSDDDTPIRHYSEKDMGPKGAPFTKADLHVTAKYISKFPGWDEASSTERWDQYHAKYPQRSAKAWAEYYRRNERAINKLVKRLKRGVVALDSQRAIPSRKPSKRTYDFDSADEPVSKRSKE